METKLKKFFSLNKKILLFYFFINLMFFLLGSYFFLKYNEDLPRTRIIISSNDFYNFQYQIYELLYINSDQLNSEQVEKLNYLEELTYSNLVEEAFSNTIYKILQKKITINKTFNPLNNQSELKQKFYNIEPIYPAKNKQVVAEAEFIIYAFNDKEFQTALDSLIQVINLELFKRYEYTLLSLETFVKLTFKDTFSIKEYIPNDFIKKEDIFIFDEKYKSKKSSIFFVFSVLVGFLITIFTHLLINIKNFRD